MNKNNSNSFKKTFTIVDPHYPKTETLEFVLFIYLSKKYP